MWWIGLLCAVGVAAPLRPARLDAAEPALEEELEARERWRAASCTPSGLVSLLPGGPAACLGRPGQAAALAALSGAQLAAGVAVLATNEDRGGPDAFGSGRYTFLWGALLPISYGQGWALLEGHRARRLPYTPRDATEELFAAPLRPRVLARPSVAVGTLALAGGAVAVSAALGERVQPMLGRPNLLGAHPPPVVGYPAVVALHGGLMIQVATTEEVLFRGLLQSALIRGTDPTAGWLLSSLIFGGVHALNAPLIPAEERAGYLGLAVPYITLVGGWIGLTYRWSGYALAPAVATHFWYNMLVTGAGYLVDPEHHVFALQLGGRL